MQALLIQLLLVLTSVFQSTSLTDVQKVEIYQQALPTIQQIMTQVQEAPTEVLPTEATPTPTVEVNAAPEAPQSVPEALQKPITVPINGNRFPHGQA